MSIDNFKEILKSKNIDEFKTKLYKFMNNDGGQMYTYIDNQDLTNCNNEWVKCSDTKQFTGHKRDDAIIKWKKAKLEYNLDNLCIDYKNIKNNHKSADCVSGTKCTPTDPISKSEIGLIDDPIYFEWYKSQSKWSFPLFFKTSVSGECFVNTNYNKWFKSQRNMYTQTTDPLTRVEYNNVKKARVHMDTFFKINFPKEETLSRFTILNEKIKEKIIAHPKLSIALGLGGIIAGLSLSTYAIGSIGSKMDRIIEVATYGNFSGGGSVGSPPDEAFVKAGLDASVESIRRLANPLQALSASLCIYSQYRVCSESYSLVEDLDAFQRYPERILNNPGIVNLKHLITFWFNLYSFSIKEHISDDVKNSNEWKVSKRFQKNWWNKTHDGLNPADDYIDTLYDIPNKNLQIRGQYDRVFDLFKYRDSGKIGLFKPMDGGSVIMTKNTKQNLLDLKKYKGTTKKSNLDNSVKSSSKTATTTTINANAKDTKSSNNIDYRDSIEFFCFKYLYDSSFLEYSDPKRLKEIISILKEPTISCLDILFQDIETLSDKYVEIIIKLIEKLPPDVKQKLNEEYLPSLHENPVKKGKGKKAEKRRSSTKKRRSSTKKRRSQKL